MSIICIIHSIYYTYYSSFHVLQKSICFHDLKDNFEYYCSTASTYKNLKGFIKDNSKVMYFNNKLHSAEDNERIFKKNSLYFEITRWDYDDYGKVVCYSKTYVKGSDFSITAKSK